MNNPIIPPTPTDAEYAKRADRPDHKMFAIDDPISYFEQWLAEAGKTEANDPNAMTLSTVDNMGLPDSRIVLLKGVDDRGFVFYSNGNSDVAKVSKQEADAYFSQRARGSQIGAWASDQSSVIQSRTQLEMAIEEAETRFEDRNIIRPPQWNYSFLSS